MKLKLARALLTAVLFGLQRNDFFQFAMQSLYLFASPLTELPITSLCDKKKKKKQERPTSFNEKVAFGFLKFPPK